MKFSQANAEIFVPDGAAPQAALARTQRVVVGAHQDDVEFMGFPLIRDSFHDDSPEFGAIITTNGAGSPRSGIYADCTDERMQEIRRSEQRQAAMVGRYSFAAQLQFSSKDLRAPEVSTPTDELETLFRAMRPEVVMTHQLGDKHDTHIATALRVIEALRRLPAELRPKQLLGGEIWRGLDWMPDNEKVRLDTGGRDALANALMCVYDSQIAGGKRYDLATNGRRCANATYADPYNVDDMEQVALAMDMTPLLQDESLEPAKFMSDLMGRFAAEVFDAMERAGANVSAAGSARG